MPGSVHAARKRWSLEPAACGRRQKVPHVGWNSLTLPRPSRLFDGVPDGAQVYFTHSYAAPIVDATAAVTTYGVAFSAAVEDGLVSGVQFHPEKSGEVGLRMLRNWLTQRAGAPLMTDCRSASSPASTSATAGS